jgi:regulator of nonsense transcripts 2
MRYTELIKLESSFRYHQKRRDQVFIEEKVKNILFIGELAKFRVASNISIFHSLKVLLDDFSHHNVELTCSLLECCGRFLFRSPDTNARMASFVITYLT